MERNHTTELNSLENQKVFEIVNRTPENISPVEYK